MAGMTVPLTLDQSAFRFRTFNSVAATVNAVYDAADPAVSTDISIGTGTVFRVRILSQTNADVSDAGFFESYQLRYSLNGAAYAPVTASTPIKAVGAAITGYAEDATTGGTILTGSGLGASGRATKTDTIVSNTWSGTSQQYIPNVWGLVLDSAQVSNDDQIDLRVYTQAGIPFNSYTVTPRVTAVVIPPTGDAVFVSAANVPASGEGAASSRAVTKPAGAQLAVFFVNLWIGDGNPTITKTGGGVAAVLRNNQVATSTRTALYLQYVDGDATGTTYTFTFGASKWSELNAQFFNTVDPDLDLATVPFNSAVASSTPYGDTAVATGQGWAICWGGNAAEYSSGGSHTPPSGFTETGDAFMSGAAYKIATASGSQAATGASYPNGANNKISTLVGIAGAPAVGGGDVSGTAAGSYGFAGTAAGVASALIVTGSTAGVYGFSGIAAGAGSAVTVTGSASGAYGHSGAAGGRLVKLGGAGQAYGFSGTADGAASAGGGEGAAIGSYGFAGVSTGTVSPSTAAGTATSDYGYDSDATGTASPSVAEGSAAGAYSYTGSGTGEGAPDVDVGSAAGAYGYQGAAAGTASPSTIIGGAAGPYSYTGAATGIASPSTTQGNASGSYAYIGTAIGSGAPDTITGTATGTYSYVGIAAGAIAHVAAAEATYILAGTAAGQGSVVTIMGSAAGAYGYVGMAFVPGEFEPDPHPFMLSYTESGNSAERTSARRITYIEGSGISYQEA
jgi:hypothetical protein